MRAGIGVAIAALLAAAALAALWPILSGPTSPEPVAAASDNLLSGAFTLAVSWEPAFCETAPQKPECRSQTADGYDAIHLSLHGLWPEPRGNEYCGVSAAMIDADRKGQWRQLPDPDLSDATAKRLDMVMPGTQSLLERHEWIKHGACAGESGERYFAASIALVDALETAGIGRLFAENIGGRLSANDIRAAFDTALGKGAGQRVTVECERVSGRTLVAELRISLEGEIAEMPDLAALVMAAPERERGCPAGEIDRAGQ